jgi:hypothetical protein
MSALVSIQPSRTSRWLELLLVAALVGCGTRAGDYPFQPRDAGEERAFAAARKDIFPTDVRADLANYRETLLLWSGVVVASAVREQAGQKVLLALFEHHYWDWMMHLGPHGHMAYVSPRGKGMFQCVSPAENLRLGEEALPLSNLAAVYGVPTAVNEQGVVILRCVLIRTGEHDAYTTKQWDYGRAWALTRDATDRKVLSE